MATRTESLLFLVDIQVKGANALRALDGELDAVYAGHEARMLALRDVAAASAGGSGGGSGNRYAPVIAPVVGQDRGIVGIRGPVKPGSRVNPVVTTEESGQASGLGSLAAASTAVGADQRSTPVPTPAPSPVPEASKSWLAQAAQEVATKVMAPEDSRMVAAIQAASDMQRKVSGPGASPLMTAVEAVRMAQAPEAEAAAATLAAQRGAARGMSPAEQLAAAEAVKATQESHARQGLAQTLATVLAARPTPPSYLSAAATAGRLGVSRNRVYEMAGAGMLPGAQKASSGAWQIPEEAVLAAAAGGGGGGGGGVLPTALAAAGGFGGRGGGLGWGRGLLGMAGLGTVAGLGGLGLEHALFTGVGLAGSAAGGLFGGGLLGLGAAGVAGVGMGTDMAGIGQAANDIKSVFQAQNALNQAIAVYGKNSTQAKAAQAQLNYTLTQFSPIAKNAVLQAANTAQAFHQAFNKATGQAEKTGAQILTQVMQVGQKFLPTIGTYAAQNMKIIQSSLQPLFHWLTGPDGMGIFNNLEALFQKQLPTAMHAFNNGIELFLRIVDLAAQQTGGFVAWLDKLLTRWNSMSNAQLGQWIDKYVADFRAWEQLVKYLVLDIADLFKQSQGLGLGIVQTLTAMLVKVHEWENSTSGKSSLSNIFTVHKQEVLALLQVLKFLVEGFGSFYLTVAPPFVKAATGILDVIGPVLNTFVNLGNYVGGPFKTVWNSGVLVPLGAFFVMWKTWNRSVAIGAFRSLATLAGNFGKALVHPLAALTAIKVAFTEAWAAGAAGSGLFGSLKAYFGSLMGSLRSLLGIGAATKSAPVQMSEAITGAGTTAAGEMGDAITTAGAQAAADMGAAIRGGAIVPPAASTVAPLAAGAGGAATVEAAAVPAETAAIASAASAALPVLLTGGGLVAITYGVAQVLKSIFGGGHPQIVAKSVEVYGLKGAGGPNLLAPGSGANPLAPGRGGNPLAPGSGVNPLAPGQGKVPLPGIAVTAGATGSSIAQQAATMAAALGLSAQEIKTYTKEYGPAFDVALASFNKFYIDSGRTLNSLTDDFKTKNQLISTLLSTSSTAGKAAVAKNIGDMVAALQVGMGNLTVGTKGGLAAMNTAIQYGLAHNAITWSTGWHDMFNTLNGLWEQGLISPKKYLTDLNALEVQGFGKIRTSAKTSLDQQLQDLKAAHNAGLISEQTYLADQHAARVASNAQEAKDMAVFVGNIAQGMINAGTATTKGLALIFGPLKSAFDALGLKSQLGIINVLASNSGLSGVAGVTGTLSPTPHGATGMRVNAPMFVAGEEAPQWHEYVLATNPAYRQRNLGLWASAGKDLGVPGFSLGGVNQGSGRAAKGGGGGGQQFALPLPRGSWYGSPSVDQGVDYPAPAGTPEYAMAAGSVTSRGISGFGPYAPILTLDSPYGGYGTIYYGHAGPGVPVGTHLLAGQQIGAVGAGILGISTGPHLEIGFGPYPGKGNPSAHAMLSLIQSLLGGQTPSAPFVGSAGARGTGQVSVPTIASPTVRGTGALATIVRASLTLATKAANAYLRAHAGTTGPGGPAGNYKGPLNVTFTDPNQTISFADAVSLMGQAGENATTSTLFGHVAVSESGLRPGVVNSIGATGLWQINVPVHRDLVAKYGDMRNPWHNAEAARDLFNSGRMGPWVASRSGWGQYAPPGYARGGIPFAGAFANGGMVTANGPTMALFGEHGRETAMFMPHYATGGIVAAAEAAGAAAPKTGAGYAFIQNPTADQYAILNDKNLTAHQKAVALAYLAHPTSSGTSTSGGGSSSNAPGSRNVLGSYQTATQTITSALNKLTAAFTAEQTKGGNLSTLATALEGLQHGTSLKSIGLTGAGLKASGLTAKQAKALIGGGPGSYGVLAQLDQNEITQLTGEASSLKALYAKAVKEHNKKLQTAILAQLSAVDGAITTALGDKQSQWLNAVAAAIGQILQNFTNQITAAANTSTTLTAIQGLTGGESLASLGLTPAILATLGLSGAQSQVGSGLSVFQALQSSQGGTLTAAQLAQAASGVSAANAGIQAQETPIEKELAYDQNVLLPGAKGQNRADLISTMQGLVQQLLGLQGSIDSNNQGLAALTSATAANTQATTSNTGAMTGTVAYSYQGQSYLATLSSDNPTSVGVGS